MSGRQIGSSTIRSGQGWLNRNVVGLGLTSFFSDFSHEMATAILPMFLSSIGASAAALGIIEGVADAVSSFVKLGAGWVSDKVGRRKPIVTLGYSLTAVAKATFALATSWWHVLLGRVIGWFGRGIRTPLRDAILADSIPPEATGRAFGFHRAFDTLGAVAGPLAAFLLAGMLTYRQIFLMTLLPGLLSVAAIVFLVKERPRAANQELRFWRTVHGLPKQFKRFLIGVGIFGIGDFAHTLLILRAGDLLTPPLGATQAGQLAVLLYLFHNVLYALASYPIGALGDRFGKRGLLAFGYSLSVLMDFGFVIAVPSFWYLALLFALGGIYLGIEDALEGAIAADLLPEEVWGIGYGVLATVNGVGDFASSIIVGALWAGVGPMAAFAYAALLSAFGAVVLLRVR